MRSSLHILTTSMRPIFDTHRMMNGIFFSRSSLYAISSGSVSVPTSTMTGAFMEI